MDVIELLGCPQCKNALIVEIFHEDEFGINAGKLKCKDCQKEYSIKDGIFYFVNNEYNFSKEEEKKGWSLSSIENYFSRLGEWQSLTDLYEKFSIPKEVAEFGYSRVQKRILDSVKPGNGNIVLDAGCGSGYFLFDMIDIYSDKDILAVGIDISTHNIKGLNKRRREQKKKNILGIVGSAQELPFKNGVIDIVTSVEALEHFADPQIAIDEMHRVLQVSGKLLLSTPSKTYHNIWKRPFKIIKKPIKKILDKKRDIKNVGFDYYDNPLYPNEVKKLLNDRSFRIVKFIRTVILPPSSIFALLPLRLTKLILKVASFIEKHFISLFSSLTNHCVAECEKEPGKIKK